MMKKIWILLSAGAFLGILAGGWLLSRRFDLPGFRSGRVIAWIKDPAQHPDWAISGGTRCANAPFILPTDGYIGYLWDDSFRIGNRHQGIDIFGGTQPGETPVLAAYEGYLTRQSDWKSSIIIRLPQDPLQPDRQIWIYYTHMADAQGRSFIDSGFPPGTSEKWVRAGTRLGLQGNYSGDPTHPTGIHLHFSIVRDNGRGGYLNELEIGNTLDPSPYFNLPLNARSNRDQVPRCTD